MSDVDPHAERRFIAEVISRIVACGVGADRIVVQYEDDLRDYEISISEGPLTKDKVAAVAAAVKGLGTLHFDDQANADQLSAIEREAFKAALRQEAAEMPTVPRFDPTRMSLAAFARELEAYCGVEPGSVLEVVGEHMLTTRKLSVLFPGDFRELGRVMRMASVALVEHDEFYVGVIGGT